MTPLPDNATQIASFRNPHGLRNKLGRLLWACVQNGVFRLIPGPLELPRLWLLRLFGAAYGSGRANRTLDIWAPWLLKAGNDCFIDKNVRLYNAFGIELGSRVILSQGAFLCTASHDYADPVFALIGKAIVVEDDAWIAADAFIAPGVRVGQGAVVGARAVVLRDVEPWTIVAGNPAKFIKRREMRKA